MKSKHVFYGPFFSEFERWGTKQVREGRRLLT